MRTDPRPSACGRFFRVPNEMIAPPSFEACSTRLSDTSRYETCLDRTGCSTHSQARPTFRKWISSRSLNSAREVDAPPSPQAAYVAATKRQFVSLLFFGIIRSFLSNESAPTGIPLHSVASRRLRLGGGPDRLRADYAGFWHIKIIEHLFTSIELVFEILFCG